MGNYHKSYKQGNRKSVRKIKKANCRREIGPLNCHRASRQGPSQESQ